MTYESYQSMNQNIRDHTRNPRRMLWYIITHNGRCDYLSCPDCPLQENKTDSLLCTKLAGVDGNKHLQHRAIAEYTKRYGTEDLLEYLI